VASHGRSSWTNPRMWVLVLVLVRVLVRVLVLQ
jgi:hypothetical protein